MPSIASFQVPQLTEPQKNETYTLETLAEGKDLHHTISLDFKRAGLIVDSIEYVKNHNSWKKYHDKRNETMSRKPQDPAFQLNETYLYHGTSDQESTTICEDGFDIAVNGYDGNFGRGIYFSENPEKYADNDIILVARVMLGASKEYPKGEQASLLRREPEKAGKGWRFYDSVKGCPENETEYVIYRSACACIELIVKFHKGKKEQAETIAGLVVPLTREPGKEKKYELEELKADNDIYRQIYSDFTKANLNVHSIKHLTSYNCWKKYDDKCKFIMKRIPQDPAFELNEKFLYHGTSAKKEAIYEEGFDVNHSNKGRFGKGIYFSDTPKKCIKYAKTNNIVLVARVILGAIKEYPDGQDDKKLKKEPIKEEPYQGHNYYDSVKGRPKDETEYVIYRNDNALVEYIVEFSKIKQDKADTPKTQTSTFADIDSSDSDSSVYSSDYDSDTDSDDQYTDAEDGGNMSSSNDENYTDDNADESGSNGETPRVAEVVTTRNQSVIPYFTLPEGELTLEKKKEEFIRITLEENDNEVDSMLNKANEDLERAIYLFYAYKQVKEEDAKRQNGEFVEDPIEDDGSPIFPPMEPEFESADWKKLDEEVKKTKMDKMIEDFLAFTFLEKAHQNLALKFVSNAKYNLDTAVIDFYKCWL